MTTPSRVDLNGGQKLAAALIEAFVDGVLDNKGYEQCRDTRDKRVRAALNFIRRSIPEADLRTGVAAVALALGRTAVACLYAAQQQDIEATAQWLRTQREVVTADQTNEYEPDGTVLDIALVLLTEINQTGSPEANDRQVVDAVEAWVRPEHAGEDAYELLVNAAYFATRMLAWALAGDQSRIRAYLVEENARIHANRRMLKWR